MLIAYINTRFRDSEQIPAIYQLSFMYYSVTGTLIPILAGLIISKFTGNEGFDENRKVLYNARYF